MSPRALSRVGVPGEQSPGPMQETHTAASGAKQQAVCCRGIAAAKATKRSETDIRESQRLDSTDESGERTS